MLYRCTFCSVVTYERLQTGLAHRQRSTASLVAEMRMLYDVYGINRFNFEDDNFIVKNRAGVARIHDLCDKIRALPFGVEFTFFCRADVVRRDLFEDLKAAGLSGIYFGLESVYPGDLEFFHKGLSIEAMFTALDTLAELGYSPAVDAQLRIMLGYITWHPLTSFESLRATSSFLKRYAAPPKLLRRKLRLYGGTEVVDDVRRLGLLDPEHPDGWRFLDHRLQGMEAHVNTLFAAVNKERDKLRTLEKAGTSHGFELDVECYRRHRVHLDRFLVREFDRLVEAGERAGGGQTRGMDEAVSLGLDRFRNYADSVGLSELIAEGYRICGFDQAAVDLFRK